MSEELICSKERPWPTKATKGAATTAFAAISQADAGKVKFKCTTLRPPSTRSHPRWSSPARAKGQLEEQRLQIQLIEGVVTSKGGVSPLVLRLARYQRTRIVGTQARTLIADGHQAFDPDPEVMV